MNVNVHYCKFYIKKLPKAYAFLRIGSLSPDTIFFDQNTFNLIGWQIKDVYNNLSVTFISSVKINQNIDDKIFILPIGH